MALLFGILVGTYSSVFVAAPILLADKRKVVRVFAVIVGFLALTGGAKALFF